jgi:adenosylhomocysteine nucleosidase
MKKSNLNVAVIRRAVSALALAALFVGPLQTTSAAPILRQSAVIGILGNAKDTGGIEALIERPKVQTQGHLRFISGMLHGKNVVLGQVESGKASATEGTTALLSQHNVNYVIFSGTAGALNPEYSEGDVLMATDLGQIDPAGTLASGEKETPQWIFPPQSMLTAASAAASQIPLASPSERAPRVWEGILISADNNDPAKSAAWRKDFGADTVDAGGAAAAQVCLQAGVPFLATRLLTNRASGTTTTTLGQNSAAVSKYSAAVVSKIIEQMQSADIPPKPSDEKASVWFLASCADFATNSPYAAKYPGFAELSSLQKEHLIRPVMEKMVKRAASIADVRRLGIAFQPGVVSGTGPVGLYTETGIRATREEARKMATLLSYLGQRSTVFGISESGPFTRRSITLETLDSTGWTSPETLRAAWPIMTNEAPELTPGFVRVRTRGSDSLLIVDRAGSWNSKTWNSGAAQIQRAAEKAGLKARATQKSAVFFEIRNSWSNTASGLEPLQTMFDSKQLKSIEKARTEIDKLMEQQLSGIPSK